MAAAGREALERAAQQEFAVALMDIKMPRMSGAEALPTVRTQHPDTLIIMTTAVGDVEVAMEAVRLGARLLVKPLDFDNVIVRVKNATVAARIPDPLPGIPLLKKATTKMLPRMGINRSPRLASILPALLTLPYRDLIGTCPHRKPTLGGMLGRGPTGSPCPNLTHDNIASERHEPSSESLEDAGGSQSPLERGRAASRPASGA